MRFNCGAINFFKLLQYANCLVKFSLRYKPSERDQTSIIKVTFRYITKSLFNFNLECVTYTLSRGNS